jgi:hypothetical protein
VRKWPQRLANNKLRDRAPVGGSAQRVGMAPGAKINVSTSNRSVERRNHRQASIDATLCPAGNACH